MTIARRFIRWLYSVFDAGGLDTTEYVEQIEREFGIVIRDDAARSLKTLGDMCDYVSRQRQEQGRPLPGEKVWDSVRRITSCKFGVDARELHPGVRYVEDLNC